MFICIYIYMYIYNAYIYIYKANFGPGLSSVATQMF